MPKKQIIFFLALITIIAFGANSVLTRLAIAAGDTGPWSFALLRFGAGALVLSLLIGPKLDKQKTAWRAGGWVSAAALLVYGVFFSYAYLMLDAGVGALILFAIVQFTMLGIGFFTGERLSLRQWIGFFIASGGLIYLLSPGLSAPPLLGALMMSAAGIGWGLYSVFGKGTADPVAKTCGNFQRAALLLLVATPAILALLPEPMPTARGIGLSLLCGGVTSALGYALWYRVLKDISITVAAISQLTVPIIAALGGMAFVSEPLTQRFVIASIVTLGGVGLAMIKKQA